MPLAQLSQLAAPLSERFPGSHSVHSLAPEPDERPATHVTHDAALAFENVPLSHLVHAAALSPEYLPSSAEGGRCRAVRQHNAQESCGYH